MHLKHLHTKVNEELSQAGVLPDVTEALSPLFSDYSLHANPFSEVLTKHKHLEYLPKHFKFIVSR